MPDIKHQFTGGKMNKDLDERLVPKGEYRDAMNIQVSTSEGSDVGTVQNILGNSEIAGQTFTTNAVCVGAIADEKNDKLYWFIKDVGEGTPYDGIFEYTSDVGVIPVLIDTNLDVLKFNSGKIITGINIIDDMLFWTDNENEPKVINIQRCKAGTTGLTHTNFINEDRDITNTTNVTPIREEHITVIKKAPKKAPTVELISQRTNDDGKIYTGVMRITPPPIPITVASPLDGLSYGDTIPQIYNAQNESSMFIAGSPQNHHYDFSNLSVGDYFDTYIETDINGESGFSLEWSIGDTLLFKEFGGEFYNEPPSIPLRDYSVKAKIRFQTQKKLNNLSIPKDTDDVESYTETEYSVTWVQGTNNVGRISLWHARGFDGVIKNIRVYDVTDPDTPGNDIMINGNFNTVDALGAPLPQWGLSGCSVNPGGITDSDGNPIDQIDFPCYPGKYNYGDAPWEIDYQSWGTAGYAKAADGMTVDGNGAHVSTGLGSGNSWANRANNNVITAATASTSAPTSAWNVNDGDQMNSYEAINQFGYMSMEGVPVETGKTYRMDYVIADTGHTYGGRNGSLLLANHGLVDPWLYANYFTDMAEEMAQNESFITPDGDGNRPRYWSFADDNTGAFVYIPGQHYIECGKAEPIYPSGSHIVGTPLMAIEVNDINATTPGVNDISYDVSFELTDVGSLTIAGDPIFSGGIFLSLVGPDPDIDYWRTPKVDQAGVYNFTIIPKQYDTANDNPYTFGQFSSGNRIQFESSNNIDSGHGFVGRIQNVSVKRSNAPNANVRCEVLDINNPPTAPEYSELRYAVDRLDKVNKIFEFKFPRFAYRYQYEDKEYSTISPFSPVAFMSGEFNYHTKKGYNLGMTNRLIEANIKDFRSDIPDGVVAIDILYKDDASPNIYVVDTIKPKHSTLSENNENVWEKGEYTISTEQISNVIPSNQLLRPWDAVPRKALAQDISGNRIIYGNYVQGYDLKYIDIDNEISEEYYPDFSFDILNTSNPDLLPKKSIKSLREYQLGVVFVDQYGRETPVISNSSGTKTLEKKEAENINQIKIGFNNNKFPQNMKYFKFFVKETSNEYYNLAMDRWYDAEDGGVWLAFPSSDRNKVDIDTFLILKKAQGTNAMVIEEAKYKVLDIQSNAPAFIKQRKLLISTTIHVESTTNVFEPINFNVDGPRVGEASFKMNYLPFFDTSGSDLDEINDSNLWIDFENIDGNVTKRYRISKITNDHRKNTDDDGAAVDEAQYSVILTEGFGSDINLITDDSLTGLSPTKIADGAIVNIYKYTEEDQAKFDGRFFVKISVDLEFYNQIITSGTGSGKYRRVSSKKLYYLSSDNSKLHSSDLTGQTKGLYDSANGDFGRFAPFFRNYNQKSVSLTYDTEDIGQYAFGPGLDPADFYKPWLQELAYYTTVPLTDLISRDNNYGNVIGAPSPKIADSHGWTALQRGGDFNTKHEQTHGDVWFIDGGPFHGENASESGDELKWADGETRLVKPEASFPGLSTGIETGDFTYFNIAVGGIYDPGYTDGNGGNIDKFFNLRDGGNTNYEENTQRLVGRFSPGQKFRFREDPNNEIYTIQPNVENKRRVRWNTIQLSEDIATPNLNYAWDYETSDSSGGLGNWNSGTPVGQPSIYNDYTVFGTQLSPNFSRGWKPRVLNSAGGGDVDWDPTGDLGPITNGLELSVNLSEDFELPASDPPNIYVDVSSLRGTHTTTGIEHNITVGMIMISHSDGATDCVFNSGEDENGADTGKAYLAIHEIEEIDGGLSFRLHLTGYSKILYKGATNTTLGLTEHEIFITTPTTAQAMVFAQPRMNGYSQYSVNRINAQDPTGLGWTAPTVDLLTGEEIDSGNPGIMAIGYNLDFVEEVDLEADSGSILSTNPAVWETEPKESIDLDIYHEASGLNPLEMEDDTKFLTIPIGSIVETVTGVFIEPGTTISGVNLNGANCEIVLSSLSDNTFVENGISVQGTLVGTSYITAGDRLKITKPNGESIIVTIAAPGWPSTIDGVSNPDANGRTTTFLINTKLCSSFTKYILNWHNCYSFGNGVESNRIRDNFNLPFISNGPKVSTTLEGDYNEEHRKYGLIYSGLYNSNSGVNNLNQFIAAEKITKDINPIYGSIQKLHSRDADLVTLCEDKCLRILANKDAVFNADGNPNLVATSNVLGQTIPFSGEFGISKNPESFASESYRAYFTDKVRGTVMRLSKDGLTPISMYGMKDWFKDNLRLSSKLIGSYDDRKDEYNITLNNSTDGDPKTVSFKEDVKGWVSFKSFVPEFGVSMASNYYTMKAGRLYKHHDESVNRNTFYNDDLVSSSVNVIFNEGPGSIKSFHTLNYEGSQSKITKFLEEEIIIDFQPDTTYNDQEHYNLSAKPGWSVGSIATDEDTGYITDFIEKEGKWFANMNKRIDIGTTNGAVEAITTPTTEIIPSAEIIPTTEINTPVVVSESDLKNDEPISQITVKTNNKNNTNGNRY